MTVFAAHMEVMDTSSLPSGSLELSSVSHQVTRLAERHRATWFIDNGIRFELECLHIPLLAPCVCDKIIFEDAGIRSFLQMHEGGTVPLRSGIIKSWWTGAADEADLRWNYSENDPAPEEPAPLPPVHEAPSSAPAKREGLFGSIAPDLRPRHLHEIRWFIEDGFPVPRATCLHGPVAKGQVCDSFHFDDDDLLPDTHDGRTELRDGTIESWWEAWGDDFDLRWKYVDVDAASTHTD